MSPTHDEIQTTWDRLPSHAFIDGPIVTKMRRYSAPRIDWLLKLHLGGLAVAHTELHTLTFRRVILTGLMAPVRRTYHVVCNGYVVEQGYLR